MGRGGSLDIHKCLPGRHAKGAPQGLGLRSEETTSRPPRGERAHAQMGLKALPLSGISISRCFTGIEMVQPYNLPEKHSSQVTSAGEERGEGSRTQEWGAGEQRGFSDSYSAACQTSQNGR